MTPPHPVLWLLILALVSGTTFAAPTIETSPDTFVVVEGASAHLRCRISNLGNNTVTWKKVGGVTISEGTTILSEDRVKYSILPVLDGVAFDLQILYVNTQDQGFYECAIKGTDQNIIMHVDVQGIDNFPTNHTISQPLNKTGCCRDQGVQDGCLPACMPDAIDLDTFDALSLCGTMDDLSGLSKCFNDGSNHDSCCLAYGVDPMCLPFCHDDVDSSTLHVGHLTTCFNNDVIRNIFKCFDSGSELLPGPPIQVSALAVYDARRVSSILVKWLPPNKNPKQVTGYMIMYRKKGDEHFMSTLHLPSTARQHRLDKDLQPNTMYEIKMLATSLHSASLTSVSIEEFIPDAKKHMEQENDINTCCIERQVSGDCRERLCSSKTWSHFSSSQILECSPHMENIFSCLGGQQDNTACCSAYRVNNECLPLCSGHPPAFNSSLLTCIFDMSVIEACIQRNYGQMPLPPTLLMLDDVGPDFAVFSFTQSKTANVQRYIVQVSEGVDGADFTDKPPLDPNLSEFRLDNLDANSYYSVRVVTETQESGSLPSETVTFLTYPASVAEPTVPPVINRPHDLKECCKSKKMPQECWEGCDYLTNITGYYSGRLATCQDHIASVLSCAADGRDHTSCCVEEGMTSNCLGLCQMTQVGQLNPVFYPCVSQTAFAIVCFVKGIIDLPRHPDVVIANVTTSTIKLTWKQPETSGLIDQYIVHYYIAGQPKAQRTSVNTTRTVYILQDLLPGTEYLISVQSTNENGTSTESPQRTVFTLTNFEAPTVNHSAPTGRALWENIVHCCANSGVSPECQDMCSNSSDTNVVQSDKCQADHHKMLACFTNGQDHSLCCRSANLPDECIPLCAGHPVEQNLISAACMSYGHRDTILGCILENQDLVPSVPVDFIARQGDQNAVSMAWSRPKTSCILSKDCKFDVHYWDKDQPNNVQELKDVQTPQTVTGLTFDKSYVFTVVARNSYGSGSPAPWVTVFVRNLNREVKVLIDSVKPYVVINKGVGLDCSVTGFNDNDPPTIQWTFNRRVLEGETNRYLYLPNVDPEKDEGTYTCEAKDSFVTSSGSIYLPIQYKPESDEIRDDVGPLGGTSRISCWFKGYPDSAMDAWLLNNTPIPNLNSTKYKLFRDARYHTGITTYKIRIDDMQPSDYGEYSIHVSNQFGTTSCTALLQNPLTAPTEEPVAPKQADPMACCRQNGVTDLCLDLCTFDIDLTVVLADPQYMSCLFSFEALIKCGADQRDHTKCCKRKGVMPYCFPFCRGNAPGSLLNDTLRMLTCVSDSSKIFGCLEDGHERLPYPPKNVKAFEGPAENSVEVTWNRPEFNHDLVEHYDIHYSEGKTKPKVKTVSEKLTRTVLNNLDPTRVYSIYVVSGNRHGSSAPSTIVKYPNYRGAPPSVLATNLVPDTTNVRLTWQASGVDSFEVYYKKTKDKSYKMGSTRNTFYLLENLEADSIYEAFVVSLYADGTQSPPAERVLFNTAANAGTNKQRGGDDDNTVAIAVGVVLAIVAVVAIILLLLFFVFRARVKSPGSHLDSVTFENPGYGNSGSVKIDGLGDDGFNYGRLQEDGGAGPSPYDNGPGGSSTMESSTDPHTYDNPTGDSGQQVQQETKPGGIAGDPATLDLSSAHLTYS